MFNEQGQGAAVLAEKSASKFLFADSGGLSPHLPKGVRNLRGSSALPMTARGAREQSPVVYRGATLC